MSNIYALLDTLALLEYHLQPSALQDLTAWMGCLRCVHLEVSAPQHPLPRCNALQDSTAITLQPLRRVLRDICAQAAALLRSNAPQARIVYLVCLLEPNVLQECTAAPVFQSESRVQSETHALKVLQPRPLAHRLQIHTLPATASAQRHRAHGCAILHTFSTVLSVHRVLTTSGASAERRTTAPPTA